LADVVARMWISNTPWKTLLHPLGLIDLVVIVSLLAPLVGQGLAFLRIARTLRLLQMDAKRSVPSYTRVPKTVDCPSWLASQGLLRWCCRRLHYARVGLGPACHQAPELVGVQILGRTVVDHTAKA
jgi:hypothetical protein